MGLKINSAEEMRKFKKCVKRNLGYQLQEIKVRLTKRCNSRCIMCEGEDDEDASEEITREEIRQIISDGKKIGLRQVKLFGGEPTLRRDLVEIVEDCTKLGVSSHLTSNGMMTSNETSRRLVAAGLGTVVLSIDSPYPKVNDYIRGVEGAYEKVIAVLRDLDSERKSQKSGLVIRVNSVLMGLNYLHLPRLVEICADSHVDNLSLNPVTPDPPDRDGKQRDIKNLFPTREEIEAYNREIIPKVFSMNIEQRFGLTEDHLYVFGRTDQEIESALNGFFVDQLLRGTICFKPWYFVNINQRAEFVACNHVKDCDEFPIGSLREYGIIELWNSDSYKRFREKCKNPLSSFEACRYCCYPYAVHNKRLNRSFKDGKK